MIFDRLGRFLVSVTVIVVALALQACMSGKAVRTDVAPVGNIQGTYTLILYGGNYGDDLETVVFLDREGDRYTLEPYAPDFVFRSKKGMTAESAVREAEAFIRSQAEFHGERFLSIRDEKGEIIGYELRPLYFPLTFGTDDVIDVDYALKENRVIIYVKLKPSLEKSRRDMDRESK